MRANNETEHFLYDYINIEFKTFCGNGLRTFQPLSEKKRGSQERYYNWKQVSRVICAKKRWLPLNPIKLMTNGFIALSYVQCISEKHDRLIKRQQIKLFFQPQSLMQFTADQLESSMACK